MCRKEICGHTFTPTDRRVYALYGLTAGEVAVVES